MFVAVFLVYVNLVHQSKRVDHCALLQVPIRHAHLPQGCLWGCRIMRLVCYWPANATSKQYATIAAFDYTGLCPFSSSTDHSCLQCLSTIYCIPCVTYTSTLF